MAMTLAWRALARTGQRLRPAGQCALCRGWSADALCAGCVARFAADVPRCPRCALRVPAAGSACGACAAAPSPLDGCIAACDYAFPWDRLIADFKFHGRVELAAALAPRLVQAVRAHCDALPQRVLALPLAPRRLAERGYNQAWELARRVARELGIAADAHMLERTLDAAPQAALPLSQRRANLHGAFFVDPAGRVALHGQHVALVDDVMTSGATLYEAATTLRRAGAARVQAWVLARTPAPEE